MTWKHLGTTGFGRLIEANDDLAAHLARRCAASDDFEALPADPELSVVCFRHLPPGLAGAALDAHQDRLQAALEASGDGWLTTTRLRGSTWLRAGIVNYLATEDDIDHLLETLRRLAEPSVRRLLACDASLAVAIACSSAARPSTLPLPCDLTIVALPADSTLQPGDPLPAGARGHRRVPATSIRTAQSADRAATLTRWRRPRALDSPSCGGARHRERSPCAYGRDHVGRVPMATRDQPATWCVRRRVIQARPLLDGAISRSARASRTEVDVSRSAVRVAASASAARIWAAALSPWRAASRRRAAGASRRPRRRPGRTRGSPTAS